ncbi:hypothetical protein ZHAS_00016236 [Anopheles sinensis]|uniref:Uncharacterized protein n=1 Tax=Anopheles sinensis TaxID=74873 RepID=A0A084WD76_ANOSI|nr:hypothetical protein ZHAS_00016236 [Anopheles sinensis]
MFDCDVRWRADLTLETDDEASGTGLEFGASKATGGERNGMKPFPISIPRGQPERNASRRRVYARLGGGVAMIYDVQTLAAPAGANKTRPAEDLKYSRLMLQLLALQHIRIRGECWPEVARSVASVAL